MTEEQSAAPAAEPTDAQRFGLPQPREAGVRVVQLPNGRDAILVDFVTQFGAQSYYLANEAAEQLGQGLVDAARMAKTGLRPAGSGLLVPGQ